MLSSRFTAALLAGCALLLQPTAAAEVHGAGAEGTVMGPVAFLWPPDRPWAASQDNSAPCGSSAGVTNRTEFPLDQGSVALTIADHAWNVEFHIAIGNNPTSESDFAEQVVSNVSSVQPGHQCYKLESLDASNAAAGTNGTIQLEYWSSYDDGKNETFYACADVTFVQATAFTAQVPCFNVTASDFDSGSSSSSSTSTATATSTSSSNRSSNSGGSGGLSSADKAGIAIGSILGGLSIIGGAGLFFWLHRKRTQKRQTPAAAAAAAEARATPKEVEEAASLRSTSTLRG